MSTKKKTTKVFAKSSSPSERRQRQRPWTKQEDQQLLAAVNSSNVRSIKWSKIALNFPSRNSKQIRERWLNYLDPNVVQKPWTPWEDCIIMMYYKKFGARWVEISKLLQGRSENSVKNRFYSTKRRVERFLKTHVTHQEHVRKCEKSSPLFTYLLHALVESYHLPHKRYLLRKHSRRHKSLGRLRFCPKREARHRSNSTSATGGTADSTGGTTTGGTGGRRLSITRHRKSVNSIQPQIPTVTATATATVVVPPPPPPRNQEEREEKEQRQFNEILPLTLPNQPTFHLRHVAPLESTTLSSPSPSSLTFPSHSNGSESTATTVTISSNGLPALKETQPILLDYPQISVCFEDDLPMFGEAVNRGGIKQECAPFLTSDQCAVIDMEFATQKQFLTPILATNMEEQSLGMLPAYPQMEFPFCEDGKFTTFALMDQSM